MEKVEYRGWSNCIKLTNGEIELIATTDVGPRIIRLGFVGGQNFFKNYEEQLGKIGGEVWNIMGGHRLWHAPEAAPRTYSPDNDPIEFSWEDNVLTLKQPVEQSTGIEKEIQIFIAEHTNQVQVKHRLYNRNLWNVTLAPWALSVMNEGGRIIIPQEEYRPHPDCLSPARPLILWHFTNMADPRWNWGTKYIQLRQDPAATTKQKLGTLNKQGWAAYALGDELFIKTCPYFPQASYADYGCNLETFTDSDMLEVETLGPLTVLEPGESVDHDETWFISKTKVSEDEAEIAAKILPLLKEL